MKTTSRSIGMNSIAHPVEFIVLRLTEIEVELTEGHRVLLIGGEPFESPILLWWNFVGRTMQDLQQA